MTEGFLIFGFALLLAGEFRSKLVRTSIKFSVLESALKFENGFKVGKTINTGFLIDAIFEYYFDT